ncbi:hypothetical protein RUESEDTHA_03495 [Ruegeria sp. THAF57]|nr:hypothetical protein RUESEDTHA_03495 [Ruegeria sp. THAF57]
MMGRFHPSSREWKQLIDLPSHFLVRALFRFVLAMILTGGAYTTTHRRKKEAMT